VRVAAGRFKALRVLRALACGIALPAAAWAGPVPSIAAPPPSQEGAIVSSDMQATVDAAMGDAARRSGLDRSALVLQSAQATVWPNGAMGCPTPGRMYTQAQVPGYRIRIQAGRQMLQYHTDAHLHLVLCPRATSTNPLPDPRV
jgi:hypothetical protein